MTKVDFCRRLEHRGYDRNLSEKIYSDVVDIIMSGLVSDGTVTLNPIGRLQVREKNYGLTFNGKVSAGLYGNKFIAFTPHKTLTQLVNEMALDDETEKGE